MIKVSVIVPVYNTEKYLDRCITSLVEQTLKDIEIILVDDGSKQKCREKCDAWVHKDERICVIHKKNEGLGYARNTGIEAAHGRYVSFVDSDDFIAPEMLQKLYERAEDTQAEIVIGGYYKKYDNGQEERFISEGIPERIIGPGVKKILLANMLGSPPDYYSDDYIGMSVWKNLYTRKILKNKDVRFPSEHEYISEDIIFHIRYMKYVNHGEVIHEPLYYYCQNDNSLSRSYRPDRFQKVVKLYLYEKQILQDMDAFDSGRLQMQRTFIANVRTCIMMEANKGKSSACKKEAKLKIYRFCKDKNVSQVLREFPWIKLPMKQRIFSLFMFIKAKEILYILANLQNYYKERRKNA